MRDDSWSLAPVMMSTASTSMVTANTNAIGPRAKPRHGPRSAAVAMSATNTPTGHDGHHLDRERHHGTRLARKVETGTLAAATASTRTREGTFTRLASVPSRPFHTSRTMR